MNIPLLLLCFLIDFFPLRSAKQLQTKQRLVLRHQSLDWSWLFSKSAPSVELHGVPLGHEYLRRIRNVHKTLRANETEPIANEDLLNFHNSQYFGKIRVGTPGKPFIVVVSSYVHCKIPFCGLLKLSSTPEVLAYGFRVAFVNMADENNEEYIQYGTGACVLDLARDTVQIGPLSVKNQTFGMAVQESTHPFVDLPFDGLVGLGFPDPGSPATELPLVDNMKAQHILSRNLFGIYMSNDIDRPGAISFGSIDPRYVYHGHHPTWFPVVSTDYWLDFQPSFRSMQLNCHSQGVADMKVDGKSMHTCPKKHCRAAVDTGSSLITAPSKFLFPFLDKLNVNEDCSKKNELPTVTITLVDVDGRDIDFDLTPDDYVLQEFDENNVAHCAPAFMPMDIPPPRGPLFVLGNNFIRKYYTVFDRDNMQVGFMKANHETEVPDMKLGQGDNLEKMSDPVAGSGSKLSLLFAFYIGLTSLFYFS